MIINSRPRSRSHFNSPVKCGGIVHGDRCEEFTETGGDALAIDIADDDAPAEDLVPEGGVQSGHGVAADHEARVLPQLVCQTGDVLLLGAPRYEPLLRGLHLIVIVGELLHPVKLENDPGPASGGHLGGPAPGKSESSIL